MYRTESNNNLFFHYPPLRFSERRKITLTPSNLLLLTNPDPLTPRSHYKFSLLYAIQFL